MVVLVVVVVWQRMVVKVVVVGRGEGEEWFWCSWSRMWTASENPPDEARNGSTT